MNLTRFKKEPEYSIGKRLTPSSFLGQIKESTQLLSEHPLAKKLITIEFVEHIPHGVWNSAVTMSFVIISMESNMDIWGYMAALYFAGMLLGAFLSSVFNSWISNNIGKIILFNGLLTLSFLGAPRPLASANEVLRSNVFADLCMSTAMPLRNVSRSSSNNLSRHEYFSYYE